MIKKALPLIATIVLIAIAFGPARQYLPSALRLQTGGSLVSNDTTGMEMDHGTITGIGLAPAAVTNPAPTAARLALTAAPQEKAAHGYLLSTTLTGPDGRPVADATVKLYALVDLFGRREMFIGSAMTDGSGVASYGYLPANTGTQQLVVRYAGQGKVTAGEGRLTFDATVAAPQRVLERPVLISFTDRVPYAAALLVLIVWGLIAFALLATARGIVSGAHGSRGKEELA